MNNFEKVKEFQNVLVSQTPNKPTILSFANDINVNYTSAFSILSNHFMEFNQRKEGQLYLHFGLLIEELSELMEAKTVVDQADAIIDSIYILMGALAQMGVNGQTLFDIVHNANMSKLWEDGKPRFNESGKVIKPPTFERPEAKLKEEIDRQDRGY